MSAYRTAALLLKGVLVLRDTFQQRVLSCHGFDVLLQLFACLGNLQGRKEGRKRPVWVMGTSSHCRAALLLIICLQIHVSLWGREPRSCPWLWCAPSASSAKGSSVVPSPRGSHGFVVCAPSASSGCQGYSPFCTLGQYSPFASRSSPPSSADPVPFSTVPSLSYPEPFCPVTNRDSTCLKYSQASARAR